MLLLYIASIGIGSTLQRISLTLTPHCIQRENRQLL